MLYYLRPGEEEQREIERRQARKIGKALTGKKTPPEAAIIKKMKRQSNELLQRLRVSEAAGQKEKEEDERI